ncbi:FtsX-like permease family protein [Nocardia mexicana]|uniref:Putative ABC transport system permease protein n=1 Tax=Nocardia mexicana TaxID=279262 RepID=A0A370H575_9NOCA|nr:ABC transporter permease [Nocardia mexicana]RDI49196.1 putative ABC transport system permease protein [Nocardia mexicana]
MIGAGWDRLRLFNIGELLIHRGRTAMSMAVMAVSAALLVAVLSIAGSVTGSVDKLTHALGGKAALEVSGVTESGFDQQLLQQIRAVPGVEAAVPMLRTRVGNPADRTLLLGADSSVAALGSDLDAPMRGQAAKLLTVPNGVLVGAAMGRAEGEKFRLGAAEVTVAGVIDEAASKDINGGHIVVAALPVAQKLVNRTGMLDSVQIVPAPGADVGQLRSALTDTVNGRAVVADPSLRSAQAGGAIQLVRFSTTMASAAALIVSAFLIYNAMSMAVAQRRPTLSLLRAIGGKRGPMVRDLIAEAAILGVVGGAIGAVVGMFAGRSAIDKIPSAMMAAVETRTEYMVPWYAVPTAIAACVLASVAAAAIAARQIYKVEPIEALVPVGVSKADVVRPLIRWLALANGIVMIVAAVFIAEAKLGRLSLASISLSIAGAVSLCFAATGPIIRLAAGIARLFGAPGALGATTIERSPRRVWATVMTVMIGVTATVAMGGASSNLVDSATASFQDLGDRDAYVSPSALAEFPTGPLLPADLRDRISAVPGVASVGAAQMAFATLGRDRVMLQAYENGVRSSLIGELNPTTQQKMSTGEGVVLSRDVASSLGVRDGSQLDMPTPTGIHKVQVLQVIPYFSAISGIVLMDIDILRQWYERPGETILGLDVAPGADKAAVLDAVRAVAGPDLAVDTGQEAVTAVAQGVQQGTSLSASILWIVVLVSTAALLNTLMLSVLERRREMGVLRAMGTSRRFMLRTVLTEAAGIGLTGAAIGLATGAAVQYLASLAMGQAMTIDVVYEPSPILLVYGVAALFLALLGSIPPAFRAARMPIVDAIAAD